MLKINTSSMSMPAKLRIGVVGLMLSAGAFIGIVSDEGYTDYAVIPTKNDRPTIGYGSTFHEDGKPVKMGEKTTPGRALRMVEAHLNKEENLFRTSLPGVSLHQYEYDVYMDWVYQYGSGAWAKSSMRTNLIAGNYPAACKSMLAYKFSGGYDCSTLINGKPNERCYGVWTRQQARYNKCMGA